LRFFRALKHFFWAAESFCTTVTSRGSGRKSKLTTSRGVIFFAAQKKQHAAGWLASFKTGALSLIMKLQIVEISEAQEISSLE
jgi:hypothetical protein